MATNTTQASHSALECYLRKAVMGAPRLVARVLPAYTHLVAIPFIQYHLVTRHHCTMTEQLLRTNSAIHSSVNPS